MIKNAPTNMYVTFFIIAIWSKIHPNLRSIHMYGTYSSKDVQKIHVFFSRIFSNLLTYLYLLI